MWRRIEAEAAAVLGGTTLATLLPAATSEHTSAEHTSDEHSPGEHTSGEHLTRQGAA